MSQKQKIRSAKTITGGYYRDGYRLLVRIAALQGLIILTLIGTITYAITFYQSGKRYFPTLSDGRMMPIVPLDQPDASLGEVLSWATRKARESLTMGYHDMDRRLDVTRSDFTPSGWRNFQAFLLATRLSESIQLKKQTIVAVPKGAPSVTDNGVRDGVYFWLIDLPMSVLYMGGATNTAYPFTLTIEIVRVPILENPDGFAIRRWRTRTTTY